MRWSAIEPQIVADGFHFLEGPRWRDDRLYFSDFYGHTVHAVDTAGEVTTVCTVPNQPSGLGFTPDGDLLVVSMLDQRVLRVRDGRADIVADVGPFVIGPANDMLVDAAGRAYVGNFGIADDGTMAPTNLLLVASDGTVSVAAKDLTFPNGAVLSPDGSRLLISETFAHRITSFAVGPDGQLTDRAVWADFAATGLSTSTSEPGTPVLPDGLALDESGAVWVADAKGSGILRVAEGGTVLEAIATPGLAVFAATLGGADRRTLFLCAAPALEVEDPSQHRHGVLLSCRVDVPGAGLP